MLTVTIAGPSREEVNTQIKEAEQVADVIELRSDLYDCTGITSKKPLMVTGPQRVQGVDARYADGATDGRMKIQSYHNFDETPHDLDAILEQMQPAAIYKVVTMAHSVLDSLRMLLFVRNAARRGVTIVGHCMGEAGQISRILGPIFGSVMTYCCLEKPVAPDQLSAQTMIDIYNVHRLKSDTMIYGLIGNPVSLSQGYLMHNRYFQEHGINAIYVNMCVHQEELQELFELTQELGFSGLSVTMPLKEEVKRFCVCDHDACNTIRYTPQGLIGCNTDGIGAVDAIEQKVSLKGATVVVLGAGGASKAIAQEAFNRGAKLMIANRTLEKAERLAKQVNGSAYMLEQFPEIAEKGYDVLVNGTSVGMGDAETSPIDAKFLLPGKVALDIVTTPKETALLKKAAAQNCTCIYGKEMWYNQALGQYRFWNLLDVAVSC